MFGPVSNFEWGGWYLFHSSGCRRQALKRCMTFQSTVGWGETKKLLAEVDRAFYMDVTLSRDKKWILFSSTSKTSSEVHAVPTRGNGGMDPVTIAPRQSDRHFFVDHAHDAFFILETNASQDGYKLYRLYDDKLSLGRPAWVPVAKSEDRSVEDMDIFSRHIVLYERTRTGHQDVRIGDHLSNASYASMLGDAMGDGHRIDFLTRDQPRLTRRRSKKILSPTARSVSAQVRHT